MLLALLRKARADLLGRPFQTTVIFVVVAVAAASLTLAATIHQSATGAFDRVFAKANGAHVWFRGASHPAALEHIGELAGVVATAGPYPSVGAESTVFSSSDIDVSVGESVDLTLNDPGRPDLGSAALELIGMPGALDDVAKPVVTKGRWLTPVGLDEIVLDLGTAERSGIRPGDPVGVVVGQARHALQVVGLAANASRPPYPRTEPALGYVLREGLARFEPDDEKWKWRFGVRLADPRGTADLIKLARPTYPPGESIQAVSWVVVKDDFRLSTLGYVLPLSIVGLFTIIAVGLVIINLIGATVLAQVRDIGILKTLGFTPQMVTGLILLEHAGMGAVAAVAGIAISMAAAPAVMPVLVTKDVPVTVKEVSFSPLLAAAVALGTMLVIGLMAFLPAWRGGRISAVKAISAGIVGASDRVSQVARLASWLRMPPVVVLGVKDAFNRPLRSALSVVSLVAAVMTATFTLGMNATIDAVAKDPTVLGGAPWDVQIRLDAPLQAVSSDGALHHIIEAQPSVQAYSTELSVTLRHPDRHSEELPSLAVSSEDQKLRYFIAEGRMFEDPGEAIVTQRLAEELGLRIGDVVSLAVVRPTFGLTEQVLASKPLTLKIVGRYASVAGDGKGLRYSLETLRWHGSSDVVPDLYGVKLKPGADVEAFKAAVASEYVGSIRFRTLESELGDETKPLLFGLTAALLLIASLNILTTAVFAVRERRRDLGILKAVGMTPEQTVVAVLSGGAVLAVFAVLIGTPLGLVVTSVLFDFIGVQMGIGAGLFRPPEAALVALVAPLMLVLSTLGVALPAWRASKVNVVEALQVG